MRNYLILLVFISLLSCKSSTKENGIKNVKVPLDGYDEYVSTKNILDPEYFEIIPLQNDSITLGLVDDVKLSDSLIFISSGNHDKIYIFDESKGLKSVIDRRGNASDEYTEIGAFCVNNGIVYILDLNKRNIQKYHIDGKYDGSIDISSVWANQITVINDDIFVYNDRSETDLGKYHLFKIDQTNEPGTFLPFTERPGSRMKRSFADNYVFERESNTLYTINDGEPEPLLKFDFGELTLPEEYLTSGAIDLIQSGAVDKYMLGVDEIQTMDDKILLKCDMKGDPAFLVYDISKDEVKFFCQGFKQDMFLGVGLKKFFINDGFLYDFYYADELCFILDNYDSTNLTSEYKELKDKLRSTITPDDNPVIFKYKLL